MSQKLMFLSGVSYVTCMWPFLWGKSWLKKGQSIFYNVCQGHPLYINLSPLQGCISLWQRLEAMGIITWLPSHFRHDCNTQLNDPNLSHMIYLCIDQEGSCHLVFCDHALFHLLVILFSMDKSLVHIVYRNKWVKCIINILCRTSMSKYKSR